MDNERVSCKYGCVVADAADGGARRMASVYVDAASIYDFGFFG